MKEQAYRFKADTPKELWPAFHRDFKLGEVVQSFAGHDYGAARSDAQAGYPTVTCRHPEDAQVFFTIPVELLETLDGQPVRSTYIVRNPRSLLTGNES